MEARPGTETDVAVWDAETENFEDLELVQVTSIGPIELLDDAIFNAGASTAIVERLTSARAEHIALWDRKFGQELSVAQADVAGARDKALQLLQDLGIKNKSYGHWTAQDVVRNDVKIVGEAALRECLDDLHELEACTKIDLAAVKRLDKTFIIKGVEPVATHSLRLTRSGE